ncbi:hypothetical protein [Kribbella sp. NPDC006257]|uniref:hypothetical protein n=1 Tax=Kribbella sp. NPDC006257 TaxID=3156738 RepID=UPI0033A985D6
MAPGNERGDTERLGVGRSGGGWAERLWVGRIASELVKWRTAYELEIVWQTESLAVRDR